jgi:ABC-type antimicrobial peptide transport system permease subunit
LGGTFSVGGQPGGESERSEWQNIEVVGVVKDAKYMDLDEKQMPAAFYPHSQHPRFPDSFIARYDGDPKAFVHAIAAAVSDIDPNLPVGDFGTLAQEVDDSVLNRRLVAQLCSFFATLAVLLACIGIYGLMSYGVTRRTNEFGVRLALGADRRRVVWLVLRETLELVVMGLAVGLGIAPLLGRLVRSFLFGLSPYDATSIVSAITGMTIAALVAAYLPARRAAKVDPMVALRYE